MSLILLSLFFLSPKNKIKSYPTANNFISLAPNITETLCWLGAEKNLRGVTNDCNYPPTVKKITPTGKYTFPDLEKIILLQPATVLCAENADRRFLKKLQALKIDYHLLSLNNISGFFAELRSLNLLLKLNSSAQINKLEKLYQNTEPLAGQHQIIIVIWQKPYIIAGPQSYLSELFAQIGLSNIAHKNSYYTVSKEIFYTKKIDYIINLSGEPFNLKNNSQVIEDLNNDIMLRLSPRLIEYLPTIKNKFIIN